MKEVGNILQVWKRVSFSLSDITSLVHDTMHYVLKQIYKENSEKYFKHLTSPSKWSSFSGSSPAIYINEEAQEYLNRTFDLGNSEILVVDFRLSEKDQVYIY